MARSKWKLTYFSRSMWRKILLFKKKKLFKKKIIFYDRSSSIPSCFNYKIIRIHKGKKYRRLLINNYNTSLKLGEFSFTRKPYHFPLKKSNKRKNIFLKK
jgi:ribosomal protein S19